MLRSMTGFGRSLVENGDCSQAFEIRSVNSRYLDIKWRLPVIARFLEPALEKIVRGHASRGRVEITLQLRFTPGRGPKPVFDMDTAMSMLQSLRDFAIQSGGRPYEPDYSTFLGLSQLWGEPESDQDSEWVKELEDSLILALDDWNESRSTEGAALGQDLLGRVMRMEEWLEIIAERAPEIREERQEAMRARLDEALAASGAQLDESRFLQEIVILADRLDVSEELTRLQAHLERLRQILQEGGDAGRKLDFTLQECFREINTCGNKLADAQLSHIVVDFKNELEKCREQAQNLE